MKPFLESAGLTIHHGDSREVLPSFPESSVDSIVTDPPYELKFMGKAWDKTGVAFDPATWKHVLRVLKPAGYMLCFGGTRTFHRVACAVEDAGFEVRDCLMWLYGTGFPKGKGCLKPAWEPILLAKKPAKKVLPLEVEACRIPVPEGNGGRYPANVIHDGGDEVLEAFAEFGETRPGHRPRQEHTTPGSNGTMGRHKTRGETGETENNGFGDRGTAARFYYSAKASQSERGAGNTHPTVKPLALTRWLVRLVTPEGGTVLDPFTGSGTTLLAARDEGVKAIGIDQDAAYCAIAAKRIGPNPTLEANQQVVA